MDEENVSFENENCMDFHQILNQEACQVNKTCVIYGKTY